MSELVAFLEARLAEDEAVARAATDGGYGWRLTDLPGANEVWADRDASGHDAFMVATTCTTLNPNPAERGYRDAAHVARHDPARVLREVTAKRATLARCAAIIADVENDHSTSQSPDYYNGEANRADDARDTLHEMAAVFEDHPDFQEQWR